MPKVLYVEADDEISDLIETVRRQEDASLAVVVPPNARIFRAPLNLQLLSRFSKSSDKQTVIVSGDPRLQALARQAGFPTYASVQAYERGIELVRPHEDSGMAAPAAGDAAAVAAPVAAATAAAWSGPPLPPSGSGPIKPTRGRDRRRALLFGGIAVAIIGALLLIFVSPSAVITVEVAATDLSKTPIPTIQGSTDPTVAQQANHVLTSVISASEAQSFQASPSGTKQIPAAAATGTVVFKTKLPSGVTFPHPIPKGEEFDTADSPPIKFYAVADTPVTVPGATVPGQYSDPSNPITVQEGTAEAKGNVPAGAINQWPGNPCNPGGSGSGFCSPSDLIVTNPDPTTGGSDAKSQVVASASDVQSWTDQVTANVNSLTAKVLADMKTKAGGRTMAISPQDDPQKTGNPGISCDKPTLPAAGDAFTAGSLTVTCHSQVTTFDPNDVRKDALAALQAAAPGTEQVVADNCQLNQRVSDASADGRALISVDASSCYSTPQINLGDVKKQLPCSNPTDADRLLRRAGNNVVSKVTIDEKPFSLFFLPCFESRISINQVFVTVAHSSS